MNSYRNDAATPVKTKAKLLLKKDCAIASIKEIECFLRSLDKAFKAKHLYKFLK